MKYEVRVRLYAYADVKVDAENEEQARLFALDLAYETPYPEISDAEVDYVAPAELTS